MSFTKNVVSLPIYNRIDICSQITKHDIIIGSTNKTPLSNTIMDSAKSRLNNLENVYLLNAAIINLGIEGQQTFFKYSF